MFFIMTKKGASSVVCYLLYNILAVDTQYTTMIGPESYNTMMSCAATMS